METKLDLWNTHLLQFSNMLISCNVCGFLEKVDFYRKIGEYEIKNFNSISKRTFDECQMLLEEISWYTNDKITLEYSIREAYIAYSAVCWLSEFLNGFHNSN